MKRDIPKTTDSRKPKEVVYVWHYLEWGGAQVYFLGLASRIKDRIKVRFILPRQTDRQFFDFCDERGISYDLIEDVADYAVADSLWRKVERHWRKLKSEFAVLSFIGKREIPDIIHIEFSPWQSVVALMILCRWTTVFVTMHNALPNVGALRRLLWKLKFAIIGRFDRFNLFASNEHAKQSLRPFVAEDFLDRVLVTHTNVNPDEIEEARSVETDRTALLANSGIPADRKIVACLGQFIDRKGRWPFLEAVETILRERDDAVFVWISNFMPDAADEKRIASFSVGDAFFLVESKNAGRTHAELMKFLRIADIFVLPSYVEGLPISLLEAMALGIPSVSTDVYAIPEALIDGETGLLVPAGDSRALANAIGRLLDDQSLRARLAADGRSWVLRNFNERIVAEKAFAAYCEAFSAGQR